MTRPFRRLALTALLLVVAFAPQARAVDIQAVTSPRGVTAWLVEDHSVPVISVSFAFQGGAALDPENKEGLAEMVSGLLDEGAGPLDSEAFQSALEDIAATLRFEAGRDRFQGYMRTLSSEADKAFELLRFALTAPRFDAEPVERIRAQLLVNLADQAENPRDIAGRLWFRTVFPDHPYGRPPSGMPETIRAITVADLKGFAAHRLVRKGLLVAVVGDIDRATLAQKLDAVFGALPASGTSADIPEATPDGAGTTLVVRKAMPQSIAIFGQAGIKRDDPDFYAATVMNYVLGGGGFSSRLTEEVREKRGLAYSVYTYLSPFEHAGLLMGGVATRNDRIAETLSLVRAEWRRMAEHGITAKELADAKTYINGSFPLRLDSSRRIARTLIAIQANALGIDYLDRRPALIDAVTLDDVRRVARRLLDADALTVVVVGDPVGIRADH